jgi:hypothetical protein
MIHRGLFPVLAVSFLLSLSACNSQDRDEPQVTNCVQGTPAQTTGSSGTALVFIPDPEAGSGSDNLSPTSLRLDDYRSEVPLANLGGRGVLEGRYVDVRNGLGCNLGFGAYDATNKFNYSHSDSRFQEAMTYYYGDIYRSHMDDIGYLLNQIPIKMVAHCTLADNAYYFRARVGGNIVGNVCLGDSYYTRGASYADDASVTIHELQHAGTTDAYDLRQSLNRLWYDEAGALNEAVSDFMAISFIEPMLPAAFDPRTFSRWALGNFIPGQTGFRGAHKCPTYDSAFKTECSGFPGFSGASGRISYVYPDGLGWPYANNFDGPNYAADAFARYTAQEEIHNTGILLEGALWDIFSAIRAERGGNSPSAQAAVSKLVMEAIKHLPKPSESVNQISPVTFREFAQWIADLSSEPAMGLSSAEQSAVSSVLTARGLIGGTPLPVTWAEVGPGSSEAPGVRIIDEAIKLKGWLIDMGADPAQVTQGITTGLNRQLDPGETVAIWFDIANTAAVSAGGIKITVSTPDGDAIRILGDDTNIGAAGTNSAQIMYSKIYGATVAGQLNPTIPVGTSYFRTNRHFSSRFTTAIWVKVNSQAAHGRTVRFRLDLDPSNGPASALDFPVRIN